MFTSALAPVVVTVVVGIDSDLVYTHAVLLVEVLEVAVSYIHKDSIIFNRQPSLVWSFSVRVHLYQ